ncbi:MAG: dihydrofolate reductase [Sphingosinicella sp.]|nr:dihydrofolate reductase [Sphingosinicella sp.]
MAKLVLSFSMSLDGFIAGPDVSAQLPMGRHGERLHDWMFKAPSDLDRRMAREMSENVGAVLLGRRTFDLGLSHWGGTPYKTPTFVLTHEPLDPLSTKTGTFIFVQAGIESALQQARAAGGGKDIVVMGANLAQQYLKAGLADEIVIQLVPVLLGSGTRLFDHIGDRRIELATTTALPSPSVTHLRFEVVKPGA